jgi:DNA-binding Lrp family transcriptional regulator
MLTSENCVLIERNRKARDTHEEAIRRSNKDYVMEVRKKLDDIDVRILKMVYQMMIATTRQISQIVFKDNPFPDKIAQRRCKKLFEYGCIDRFEPRKAMGEGAPQAHYVLARIGGKILEKKGFKPITKLQLKWRHVVAVNEILVSYANQYKVNEWQTEIKCYIDKQQILRSDAFIGFIKNERDIYALVEVDLGSENMDVLKNKIDQYHKYLTSSDMIKADWQPYEDKPIRPPVLFALNDEKRLKQVENYYKKFVEKTNSPIKCTFKLFDNLISTI